MISVGEGLIKTPGDVPGLARQSPRGLWKDEIENEISVEDAGVGQTRMARAPAIVRPETQRGPGFVDSRAVHHPIKAKKTGKGALDVKTLSKEARAGITVRLPFTRTALAAALLIGTGGENTRIPTKAALAVLLIAQFMTSGCLCFRAVLIARHNA